MTDVLLIVLIVIGAVNLLIVLFRKPDFQKELDIIKETVDSVKNTLEAKNDSLCASFETEIRRITDLSGRKVAELAESVRESEDKMREDIEYLKHLINKQFHNTTKKQNEIITSQMTVISTKYSEQVGEKLDKFINDQKDQSELVKQQLEELVTQQFSDFIKHQAHILKKL